MKIEVRDLQVLRLQPGMHLVLRVKGRVTAQQAASVKAIMREWAGEDFPVLVLDDSASLEVVAAEDDAQEIVR